MSEVETKSKLTPEESRLRNQLARSLWDVDMKDVEFSDMKARNEKFAEDGPAYRKKAVMLVRRLTKRGVTIIAAPTEAHADEGETGDE